MRSRALSIAHTAGARVHLPLPDVPEGIRWAIHGVRACQARRPALDAREPVDLRELEHRRAEFLQYRGTPLTYHRVGSGSIAVTIGSLDAPEAVRPIEQFGVESGLSWISGLGALPAKRTEDWKREHRIPHIDSHQRSA
jgi:hypothetical protein